MEMFRVRAPLRDEIVHFHNPESGIHVPPGARPLTMEWEPAPGLCYPLVVVIPETMAIEGYGQEQLARVYDQAAAAAGLTDWYADLRRRYVPEND